MLKHIDPIIGPDLIHALMAMGHGEEIVICDGNMPVNTLNKNVIRMDGHHVCEILKAVLEIFPLDDQVAQPVALVDWDGPAQPIWETFKQIITDGEEGGKLKNGVEMVKPADFFERSRKASWLIATTEPTLAANILLRKGIM